MAEMTKKQHSPTLIVQEVMDTVSSADFELPDSTDELWSMAVSGQIASIFQHIKNGLVFIKLKSTLSHGQYEQGLQEIGIPLRTARDDIAVAKLFMESPNRRALADFSFTGLIELTRLPDEKISNLDENELKNLSELPSRALKATVKEINDQYKTKSKLEAENDSLRKKAEHAENRWADVVNEFEHYKLKASPETIYGDHPLLAFVKELAPQLAESLHQTSLDCLNLVERCNDPKLDFEDKVKAANALYHFMIGPAIQVNMVIKRLEDTYGEHLDDTGAALVHYSEQQWEQANERRQTIIQRHTHTSPSKKSTSKRA